MVYGGGDAALTRETKVVAKLDLNDKDGYYAKGRELNKWGANSLRQDRPTMFFSMKAPDGTEVWPIRNDGLEGCWRFGKNSNLIRQVLEDPNVVHWEKRPFDGDVVVNSLKERWVPYEKIRDERKVFGWSTWLDDAGTNAD